MVPRVLLVSAFLFLITGYLGIKSFYSSGLPPETKNLPNSIFFALVLCSFLVGLGGSSAYTASVNSTAKTFLDMVVVSQVNLAVTLVESFIFSADRLCADCRHLSFQGFLTGDTSAHGTDKFDASNHDVSSQMEGLFIGPWQLSEAKCCPGLLLPHYH